MLLEDVNRGKVRIQKHISLLVGLWGLLTDDEDAAAAAAVEDEEEGW